MARNNFRDFVGQNFPFSKFFLKLFGIKEESKKV
jgi:hypothetical protein